MHFEPYYKPSDSLTPLVCTLNGKKSPMKKPADFCGLLNSCKWRYVYKYGPCVIATPTSAVIPAPISALITSSAPAAWFKGLLPRRPPRPQHWPEWTQRSPAKSYPITSALTERNPLLIKKIKKNMYRNACKIPRAKQFNTIFFRRSLCSSNVGVRDALERSLPVNKLMPG